MASDWQINRLLAGLHAVKMIRQQFSHIPTDLYTSPPPPPTSGGNDELEQSTTYLRVDHHL